MGTKYSSIAVSGFNSSPPSDDGSTAASNQVYWATIKTKLADPLNSFAGSVNSALVTALDQSVRLVSSSDSTTAADHDKTVQIASTVTSAVTISLLDAATAAAGYIVTVSNQSAIAQTVGRLTASNTINGATSDYTLPAYHSVRFLVASPAAGYVIVGQSANTAPATLTGTETLTNKTLVAPALGTPASGVVTNLTGTASININGTVGATTANTGAFTTISASGSVTLSGGTANGVAYLNGSKVVTSGSALKFDGANLGIGATPSAWFATVYNAVDIGAASAFGGLAAGASGDELSFMMTNAYINGSNQPTYKATGFAVNYRQFNGTHVWQTVASGTAGNTFSWTDSMTLDASSNLAITGALSKGSGSFRIPHPLKPDTHQLVHSFIEGPQADLIYRGAVTLANGSATVNIDAAAGMTEGTFTALCREVQCFTSNESSWVHVRGSVNGNVLTIESQDPASTARVSWMVIGERKDPHMYKTEWTDDDGKVIVEPLKPESADVEV